MAITEGLLTTRAVAVRKPRSFLKAVFLFAVLALQPWEAGAQPWQQEWERTVKASEKEGKVVVWAVGGRLQREWLADAFQKAYPKITVEFLTRVDRAAPKIIAEQQQGLFLTDIIVGGTNLVEALLPANALAPIPPVLIHPDARDQSKWLEGKFHWADDEQQQYSLLMRGEFLSLLAVNTKLADPASFRSYWDIVDPKWKGKIVMQDVRAPGPGGGGAVFFLLQPELGEKFLRKLFGETNAATSTDRKQAIDWLARGRYALSVFPDSEDLKRLQREGFPIKEIPWTQMKEGSAVSSGTHQLSLLKQAPHPNAAKVYINWLLSKEGQTAQVKYALSPSLRLDVPEEVLKDVVEPWERIQPDKKYIMISQWRYRKYSNQVRNLARELLR
jgi:ABC-type Fe3+ transport system substrate-binding protein